MQPMSSGGADQTQPSSHRVALRWSDMDRLGHVNQAIYHELLEEPRTAILSGLGASDKESFVLAHVVLDYRREIPQHHRYVDVTLQVVAVGRSSVTVRQQILRSDGELAAEGESVMVAWDSERRRSRPLGEREMAALNAMLVPQT